MDHLTIHDTPQGDITFIPQPSGDMSIQSSDGAHGHAGRNAEVGRIPKSELAKLGEFLKAHA